MKFGKWAVGILSLFLVVFFVLNFILPAFATMSWISGSANVTTSSPLDKWTKNGTSEWFYFDIVFTGGANVTGINITVPYITTKSNFSIVNTTNVPTINMTGWGVTYPSNNTAAGFDYPKIIMFNTTATGNVSATPTSYPSVRISINATPILTESGDVEQNDWGISVAFANSTETTLNTTTVSSWVDSRTPVVNTTTPANNGYISGNNSQLFQVYVYDSNFNPATKNASLYYRKYQAGEWSGSEGNMNCWIQTTPQYICNKTVDNLLTLGGDTTVIQFFFNASDNVTNVGNNGTESSSLSATIDRTAPTNMTTSIAKVGNGTKYDTIGSVSYGFQMNWTDSSSGVSAVYFESNFTGSFNNTTTVASGNAYYLNFTITDFSAAGTYAYKWYAKDNVLPAGDANWRVTDTYYYTVNKADNPVNLFLNNTQNQDVTDLRYPATVNATGTVTAGEMQLWRNKTGTWTNVSTTENNTAVNLPVGAHAYTVNTTGNANYSANNSAPSYYVLISQGATNVTLTLNGTSANKTIASGDGVNITARADNSEGVLWIYNGTDIANQSSGNDARNITSWSGPNGTEWNITAYYNGSQNYSASSLATWYIKIETTPPTYADNYTNVTATYWGKYQGVIGINAAWNDNFNLSRVWMYNNTSGGWGNTYGLFGDNNVSNFTIDPSIVNIAGGNVTIQAIIYANDTSNNTNNTITYQWTIDGTPPTLSGAYPSNNSYVYRNNSYPFSISVSDNTLNVSNATIHFRESTAEIWNTTYLTCTGSFTCSKNINLNIYTEGNQIYYYFEASDNSSSMGTSGSSSNPYVITLDMTAPKYSNNNTNVTVVGKYDGVLIYANWTDAYTLDWAVLETNETGSAQNYTGGTYGSPYDINAIAGQTWSNFSWSNNSLSPGTVVQWRIFANDSVGNQNVTPAVTFTIDNTIPYPVAWSTNTSNGTTIAKGTQVAISANWSDNVGLITRGYYWVWYNESVAAGINRSYIAFTENNLTNSSATIDTSSFTNGITFWARFYVNDTSNNTNSSETWVWTIDGTKPFYTNNGTNVTSGETIVKGTPIDIYANWNDDLNVSNAWVEHNETTMTNTSVGFTGSANWTNYTIDTTGATVGKTFLARIFVNDTSGNENYTAPTWSWTIDGTAPTIGNVTRNADTGNGTAEYNPGATYIFNVTTTDNLDGNVSKLLLNFSYSTSNYTATSLGDNNYSVTVTDLPVGEYFYKWFANDTSDNWAASAAYSFNVTQNTSAASFVGLALNGTEANTTYIYPQAINATAWRNFTEVGNLSLWKESSIVNSTLTASSRSQEILLGNGTYNYTLTFTSTNYSAVSITGNRFALVVKGPTNVSLWINNAEANGTTPQGTTLNITAKINTTYGVILNINTTITPGWVNQSTTNTRIENTTSTSAFTVANNYNVTASFDGDGNFTASSRTFWLNITQDVTGPTVKIFDTGLNDYNFNNTTARKSDATINMNVSVSDAGIGVTSGARCYANLSSSSAANVQNFANYSGSTSSGWCNGTMTIPTLTSGVYLLNITVNDTNNNTGVNATYYLTVDNVVPVLAISSPANASYNKLVGRVWINGSISDNLQMGVGNISINDTRFAVYNFTGENATTFAIWNTSAVNDGRVDIKINYTDNATNTGEAGVYFTEDNTAPSAVYGLTNSSSQSYATTSSQNIEVRVDDAQQTNSTITLYYYLNGTWFSTTLGGIPSTSTTYSGTISTIANTTAFDAATGKGYMPYYITGVDNATNSITNGGSIASPLANLTFGTTGSIDGYVLRNDTSAAISGATVSDGTRAAVTNSNGYYIISSVPAGTYTVTATAIDYTSNSTSSVSVTAGATTRANVTMAYTATGVIQGYVLQNGTSTAISGATVSDGTRAAVSNSVGFYRISSVPVGTYTLTVSAANYVTNSSAGTATVTAGATTTLNVTLVSNATGVIQGYVYLTNTSIVPNGTVQASDGTRTANTNTAGLYQITGVPSGTYTLTVSGIGYRTNSTSVTVTAGATTTQNMRVTGAENFNITLPGTSGTSTTGFWDIGWRDFYFRTGVYSAGTTNYTVEYLFLTMGTTGNYNYSAVWRYNATSQGWASFIPKRSDNTLTNVSSSSDHYWIYVNGTDRAELEARYS